MLCLASLFSVVWCLQFVLFDLISVLVCCCVPLVILVKEKSVLSIAVALRIGKICLVLIEQKLMSTLHLRETIASVAKTLTDFISCDVLNRNVDKNITTRIEIHTTDVDGTGVVIKIPLSCLDGSCVSRSFRM